MPSPARKQKQPEIPAEPVLASEVFNVPYLALVRSPRNVRKTDRAVGVAEMAEDIWANGLLQNLDVTDAGDGIYAVEDGDRRWQALGILVDSGRIFANHPVPVLVVPQDKARGISLSSAIHKVALNPADEFEAFAALIAEIQEFDPKGFSTPDAAIAECARRQGVSVRRVEQSLRLASLAPEILGGLRVGELTLDAARAYAGVDDAELQLQVFQEEQRRAIGDRHRPTNIRYSLGHRVYSADGSLASYVGLAIYLGRGGRSAPDLFMGSDLGAEKLLDPQLLRDLARERAEADLPGAVARDGFEAGLLTPTLVHGSTWPPLPAGYMKTTGVNWPRDPERLARELPKPRRKRAIGIYALADDGSALKVVGWYERKEAPAPRPLAPAPSAPAALDDDQRHDEAPARPMHVGELRPEAYHQQLRDTHVRYEAAHLAAAPGIEALSAELGCTVSWPGDVYDVVEPLTELPDGRIRIALLIDVDPAEVEAMREMAERKVNEAAWASHVNDDGAFEAGGGGEFARSSGADAG